MEWTIINEKKKIMAITNFAPHENFKYLQKEFTEAQIQRCLNSFDNIQTIDRANKQKQFAKAKFERVEDNYEKIVHESLSPAA